MLSPHFLMHLEQRLSEALRPTNRYWCDGVLGPEWESDYLPEYVAQTHQLVLRAWIDEGRTQDRSANQAIYRLVLQLGPHSLQAYLDGNSLTDFVLPGTSHRAVAAPEKQLIEWQLP